MTAHGAFLFEGNHIFADAQAPAVLRVFALAAGVFALTSLGFSDGFLLALSRSWYPATKPAS